MESLLERLTGTEKSVLDADGDSPVRYRDALYFIRLVGDVEADLMGENIDPDNFRTACSTVASVTDTIAPGIAERFGGRLAFDEEKSSPAPDPAGTGAGLYL